MKEKKKVVHTTNYKFKNLAAFIKSGGAVTCTACFNKKFVDEFFVHYNKLELSKYNIGDYPMWIWIASKSKIKVLGFVSSVYRIHNAGSSSHSSFTERIQFIENIYSIEKIMFNNTGHSDIISIAQKKWFKNRLDLAIQYREFEFFINEKSSYYKTLNSVSLYYELVSIFFHSKIFLSLILRLRLFFKYA